VRRYNALVSDAYHAGDVSIALPIVGDAEARKLAGHIRARGSGHDARRAPARSLAARRPRDGDDVVVSTGERWEYAERRMGSASRWARRRATGTRCGTT
jgi:hypothetical protein